MPRIAKCIDKGTYRRYKGFLQTPGKALSILNYQSLDRLGAMGEVRDARQLEGTLVFSLVGRMHYGFDVFAVHLPHNFQSADPKLMNEKRLTDGESVNYNARFVDASDANLLLQGNAFPTPPNISVNCRIHGNGENSAVVYVSERTGNARIHFSYEDEDGRRVDLGPLNGTAPNPNHEQRQAYFFDRPVVKNGRVYFVSSQEPADKPVKSWSAVYSTSLENGRTVRLTPPGAVDYSPAISPSGQWIAVASYGSAREWEGQLQDLETDLYIMNAQDGSRRTLVARGGGWPAWADERTLYFHKRGLDGVWSVYRSRLPRVAISASPSCAAGVAAEPPERITPPSVHAFTPCASPAGDWIAVATRRPGCKFRHVEIFDLRSDSFVPLTHSLGPEIQHYNPFVSSDSRQVGFHRPRGGPAAVPCLESVESPLRGLRMLRIDGSFPAFSPDGSLIAYNPGLAENEGGVNVVRADGSQMWRIFDGPAFAVSWNGKQKGVVYTSLGPIFAADRATVHIISLTFDPEELGEGKAQVRVLTKEGTNNNAFPCSSPDGGRLVFRSGRSGHKNLYIMDARGGEESGIVRLTEGPWIDTMPSWSLDGQWIAFSSDRDQPRNGGAFGLYLIRPDGTGLHRVRIGSEKKERLNHVCFSPDSKSLLFTGNLSGVNAEPISLPNQFQPYGELYVAALDGSELQRLTFNAYEDGTPAWHPSSPALLKHKIVEQALLGQFDEPLWLN